MGAAGEELQVGRRSADGVTVRPAAQPSDPVGPVSLVLVALTVVACVALALGAPIVLLVIPCACVTALAVLTVRAVARARAAEHSVESAADRIEAIQDALRTETEARENAESRLAWRTRLGSLRRVHHGATMIDPESGLTLEGWLTTAVETRIAAGRRRLTPVAIVMFEVLEYVQIDDPRAIDARTVADLLTATVREADGTFRLDDGGFAVLLDDTDDMGALLVTKRFGDSVEAMAPGAVVRAGVACYPAHGMTGRELLDRADEALDQARRWRQHRIEVARTDH